MRPDWKLHHEADDPEKALFPQNAVLGNLPEFVKISHRGKSVYLESGIRKYANGNQVHVWKKILVQVDEGEDVTVSETSRWNHYRYLVTHLPSQKFALVGLLIALGGLLIDGGFELGNILPVIRLTEGWVFALVAVGIAAKVLGLFLAFWKGFIQR
jgi:hypothetical protein